MIKAEVAGRKLGKELREQQSRGPGKMEWAQFSSEIYAIDRIGMTIISSFCMPDRKKPDYLTNDTFSSHFKHESFIPG